MQTAAAARRPTRARLSRLAAAVTGALGVWLAAGCGTEAPSGSAPASPSAGGDACASAMVARMTVAQQAGQVLMIGTPLANPTALAAAVRTYHLGGVFLSGRSSQSAGTLRSSIDTLQDAARTSGGLPVQVATDQEGGQVQSLRGTDFPTIPSALEQGQLSTAAVRDQAAGWAARLAHAGITIDLAPVADTVPAGTADLNPPIGKFDRQYGDDPHGVAQDVSTVVTAVQGAGVLTTLKHFPGLGRVRANTDTSTKAVDDQTTVDDPALEPFTAGIRAGTAAVMISSARYPKLDPDAIAAFSEPIITGLLRDRLGFTGLIVSDDLGAAVAPSIVPVGDRAVRFIQAGGDLVLTIRTADAGPMTQALVAQAQSSGAFAARLRDAARHVIASKLRAGLIGCPSAAA